MATSNKVLNEELRSHYFNLIMEFLENSGEDALQIASNKIAFPVVDRENNEKFIELTIKVPTGSKDEIYDGYSLADDYKIKEEEKKIKAEKQAELKAKKIERDKIRRAKQAELKAKREERKGE